MQNTVKEEIDMLKKNDIVELTVTSMSFEGLGVARYSDEEVKDFVVFIHNAVVGDIVDSKIVKVLTRYAYAIIDKIISPSPDRINSLCGSFPKCGGCTYLNVSYESELKYKHACVVEAFKKNYPKCEVTPKEVVPSPKVQNYRNKVQYPISQDKKFGFYARHSHRNVVIEKCHLQDQAFEKIIHIIEEYIKIYHVPVYNEKTGEGLIRHLYLRRAPSTGEIMVCIVINGKTLPHKEQLTTMVSSCEGVKSICININLRRDNVILGRDSRVLWGEETITDELCGFKFKISPLSFYQVNTYQAEQLYNYVTENTGLKEDDIVLDLYCGIGTISLAVSRKVNKVIGVEVIDSAVTNACENAVINKIKNVEFYTSDVSNLKELFNNIPKMETPNVVIVDPPRKGLTERAIEAIKDINPEKIIYISCNPATQSRDLSILNSEEHLYEVKEIMPFDMFPRTGHVECVAVLERKDIHHD